MKLNKHLNRFRKCRYDDVAYHMLINLPGVWRISRSNGYYGSVRVTMADGREFCEQYRYHWSRKDPWLTTVRKVAYSVLRYLRERRT